MSRFLWPLITLLVAAPAGAQTCLGVLRLTFAGPVTSARPRPLVAIRDLDVRARFLTASIPAGTTPVAGSVSGEGSRTVRPRADTRHAPTTLLLSPECGTTLLHLVLVYRRRTMTLNLYNVPDHIGLNLDAPVPFRSGRFVLDFDAAQEVGHHVFSAADIRPAGR